MDTDTLREKFIRSEEALNKLADDIKQLVSSQSQELRDSRDYLETLIGEKEAVDSQIKEQEAKIASYQEDISKQGNLKEALVNKRSMVSEDSQNKKIRLEELHHELTTVKDSVTSTNRVIEQLRMEITQKREHIGELIQANQELEEKLKIEMDVKVTETGNLEQAVANMESENAVISYLLEESAEDIPEVDILASVMQLGEASRDQLKQSLEGIVSPVMLTRTLGRMAEKGILNFDESRDIIRYQ
ncbi:MAG: hypothetical protein ACFFE8_07945 [Candidatus Heimdallarchaeota archaeon]